MYFSAAHSSENDQGNMNLASNTAPVGSTTPSRVAPIQRRRGCRTHRWTCLTAYPVLHSYQRRLTCSVATPSWTSKFPDQSGVHPVGWTGEVTANQAIPAGLSRRKPHGQAPPQLGPVQTTSRSALTD